MTDYDLKLIPDTITAEELINTYLPLLYTGWREEDLQGAILHVQNLPDGTNYYNPHVPYKHSRYAQNLTKVLYWSEEVSGDVIFIFGFSDKRSADFNEEDYLFLKRLEKETDLRFVIVAPRVEFESLIVVDGIDEHK